MPTAQPPLYYTLIAAVVGLACTAIKVFAIGDTEADGWVFLGELLGVLAGASFAAAGVNQVARLWLGSYWVKRTAPIVQGRTQEAVTTIWQLARVCMRIAYAAATPGDAGVPRWPSDSDTELAFQLPQTDQVRTVFRITQKPLQHLWFHPPADADAGQRLVAALDVHAPAIAAEMAACEALLALIARYREEYAISLDQASLDVRKAAAGLLRDADAERPSVKMTLGNVMGLYDALHETCKALTDAYAEVARVTQRGSYLITPQAAFTADDEATQAARLKAARASQESGGA